MAAPLPSLLRFIIFFVVFLLMSNADPHVDIVTRNCSDMNMGHKGARFIHNYWGANMKMEDELSRSRFAISWSGEPATRAYVMAQCHRELSRRACTNCYVASRTLLTGCFPLHMGGRVYMDGCFLRAANYNFFEESVGSKDVKICGSSSSVVGSGYGDLVERVVRGVVEKAGRNDEGFGVGAEREEAYGMGECWKTLKEEDCRECLEKAASSVLSCLPATEGRALMAGCVVRYADYAFLTSMKNNNAPSSSSSSSSSSSKYAIFGLIACVVMAAVVSIMAICIGVFVGRIVYHRKYGKADHKFNGMGHGFSLLDKGLQFKYSALEKATNNFSECNKLGHGGTGEVYKGCLEDGREIAIKRLFRRNTAEDILNEVNVISLAKHKNLVRFLGCSLSSQNTLLVYEFLPFKSLDNVLFHPERKKELDWKKRLGILIGTAEGLEYLHRDCEVKVVHRDIKSHNILLDSKYRPKIADFGLAKLYSNGGVDSIIALQGTLGYMAPEYIAKGQLTEKVDVYSYGVLVLEIISGVQNNEFKHEDSVDTLVTSAWKHFQSNTVLEIIDGGLEVEDTEEVKRAVHVGLLCTQEVPSLRPSMTEILEMLKQRDRHLPMPSNPPFVDESMEIAHHHDAHDETNSFQHSTDGSSKSENINLNQR